MKKFLKKLGFHKMDEMEQYIAFRAQRNAYFFLIGALAIWAFYESYKTLTYHTQLNLIPCAILILAQNIQTISQLIMTRKAVKDEDEDTYEIGSLVKIIFMICLFAAYAILTVSAIMITGVKI